MCNFSFIFPQNHQIFFHYLLVLIIKTLKKLLKKLNLLILKYIFGLGIKLFTVIWSLRTYCWNSKVDLGLRWEFLHYNLFLNFLYLTHFCIICFNLQYFHINGVGVGYSCRRSGFPKMGILADLISHNHIIT